MTFRGSRGAADTTGRIAAEGGCRVVVVSHPLYRERELSLLSDRKARQALEADTTSRRILGKGLKPRSGDLVGVRLNINVLKSQGIAVQTIHAGNERGGYRANRGFFSGEVITYRKCVTLGDCYFNVHQKGREAIAAGRAAKYPMASIDGVYRPNAWHSLDGIEVRFNPHREHLFVDMANRPVRWAEEVTIYGHRAYARGMIEYYTENTAPVKAGDAPSAVCF